MKKSTSQTSLKSAPQAKTGTTRSAVSSTLRRQTSASTMRRGAALTQARPAPVSATTKRQTIASRPPTTANKNASSKAPASDALLGPKGEYLGLTKHFDEESNKYLISRHLNFTIWQEFCIMNHFNFAFLSKTQFILPWQYYLKHAFE